MLSESWGCQVLGGGDHMVRRFATASVSRLGAADDPFVAVEVHDETGDVAIGLWDGPRNWHWVRVDGVVSTGGDGQAAYDRVFGRRGASNAREEVPACVHACCS